MKGEHRRQDVCGVAAHVLTVLRMNGATDTKTCGSFRRCKEVLGDLDFIALCPDQRTATRCAEVFRELADDSTTATGGAVKSTAVIDGISCDLIVTTDPGSWGALLMHATGSKRNNIKMRAKAKHKGLKLNEKGLWKGDERSLGI